MAAQPQAIGAEEDLEALFDQIADQRSRELSAAAQAERPADNDAACPGGPVAEGREDLRRRIGQLTRRLHDTLSELGYDEAMSKVMHGLPDARDRLSYVAKLTGQAADKALNSVDRGQVLQSAIGERARALSVSWEKVYAKQASVEEFRSIAGDTREFLAALPAKNAEIGSVFTDIMMAQDFHDLTGQVIMKITDLSKYIEEQLLRLLVETTPSDLLHDMHLQLAGPVVNGTSRANVVTSQEQVDELLDKLGF